MLPADIALRNIRKEEAEEEDEDEPLVDDPVLSQLKEIKKQLADKEPGDPWPSMYIPQFRKAEKTEPIVKEEPKPDVHKKGIKKSIDGYYENRIDIEKIDDELDEWPSVFDASIYRSD
ncbi:hypothetical protein ES703_105156 [subsurface metagenome]